MPTPDWLALLLHDCHGLTYAHPVLVALAFLIGAQVPNAVRLCGSLSRLLRFWR